MEGISLAAIVAVFIAITGGGAAYGDLRARLTALEKTLDKSLNNGQYLRKDMAETMLAKANMEHDEFRERLERIEKEIDETSSDLKRTVYAGK
jgi:hypothetical protein